MKACLTALLPLLLLFYQPAHAQARAVNRCTDASGRSVFTDRSCDSLGAQSRLPPPPPPGNTPQRDTLGARCPRRLSDLVGALRSAVGGNDVNRLSSVYLWGAMSDEGAQRVLGQLEAVVRRPLVDIVPVYREGTGDSPTAGGDGEADAAPRRPIALRLEQTLPGTATPSRTVLALRRQYGCFWVTL
ncbi:DUF4124 domain-containing protein [Stenotrophomonas sp. 24(2023)]|uniref:DUF4124 domain-containing protein n=1 Tax=Stenotrophomonas sp. 24(2023) TaxID=3068324 RepID=UPI0027E1924E|nr:DUF4124 domain-containing protein [Stenotrophomonas sp. 24(2023)]WMJ67843.1 DUF4124 domain-containing protein [Stenotrophomonas sp. 24(2023)]